MRQGRIQTVGGMLALVLVLAGTAAGQNGSPLPTAAPAADDRLVAIGGLSGAQLYTSYAYLNVLADAHRQQLYPPERVRELLTEVIRLTEASTSHLRKVKAAPLIDRDKQVLEDFLTVYQLLGEEAQALADYSRSGADKDWKRFQQTRTIAWAKLKGVLGIKQPTAEAEGGR